VRLYALHEGHHLRRVTFADDLEFGKPGSDIFDVGRGQVNVECAHVVFQIANAFCSRNGHDIVALRENPGERKLRGRRAPAGQSPAALHEHAFAQRQAMERAQQGAGAAGEGPLSSGSGSAWQALGPAPLISDPSGQQSYGNVAGRVTAIAVDQSDTTGNTVYAGAAYGGVWKSTNAAAANAASVLWTPIADDQATLSIGAIAVSPDGQTVLVGTGEANNSVDSYYGLGILRSTNSGASWTLISNATGAPSFRGLGFSKIAFNANNPSQVVAAVAHVGADEGSNAANNTVGLYFSGDGGASWSLATVLDGGTQVISGSATDVVFDANNGTFYAAYRAHGFYQSSNGGQTWTQSQSTGLATGFLATGSSEGWAYGPAGALWHTNDAGRHWTAWVPSF